MDKQITYTHNMQPWCDWPMQWKVTSIQLPHLTAALFLEMIVTAPRILRCYLNKGIPRPAMSTFNSISSQSSDGMRMCMCVCVCVCVRACMHTCVCVDGMNLKYAVCWHIHISVHSILCQCCTQAHIHPQTICGQQTDRAKSGYCPKTRL